MQTKDLVVLVADRDIQATFEGLLSRNESLGIRGISFDLFPHLHRDPGCRAECHDFLISFHTKYKYAIVVFDRDGCGRESLSSIEIETEVERILSLHGWDGRCIALALDPELEIWVWSNSPHVGNALGWTEGQAQLQNWLIEKNYLQQGKSKPRNPKGAMFEILKKTRKPRSASIFKELAQRVSFQRCVDPSFLKLKDTLQKWFPANE